jgi:magnesium-transporting ATPase (P-type)
MILFLNLFRFCKIFIHQILNPLTYLLLLAAGIIFFTGSKLDCFIILAILLLSAILGAIQSYRTDNIILKQSKLVLEASLKQLSFFILILITATCILLLILGLLTGKIWSELFSMLIALFICMVPEGLPIALKLSASTNIFQKVVLFFFATNLGQVLIVFGLLILQLPIPILAPQFLWLNIVTDGFLCTALALEPVSTIQLKDEQFSAVIINRQIIYQMVCMALTAAIVGIFVFLYYYFYQNNLAKAQTAVFW